ncbi:hypothetical protein EAH88_02165 [Rhodanobacter glycinis]|uniref:DUF4345 domain-containing protein n=1 Tax=Rhodanobacter glycinis TaxID=582702 RepID=A0A502CFI7_9GAMM|nr:DUF6326 family protein [Rhodanobacter glycinis]TPG11364.1 hypothetical protein EAH88_02165 [Rhodanobacter glycinis]
MAASPLVDVTVPVRAKLSALWAALMFCYIYGDYFGLYVPGKLSGMINGEGPIGHVSQSALVITSILLAVPGLMVFLSLVLPAAICRWGNIVLGAFYIAVMALTMPGAWSFYILLGVVEIAVGLLTVWYAWSWPRQGGTHTAGES